MTLPAAVSPLGSQEISATHIIGRLHGRAGTGVETLEKRRNERLIGDESDTRIAGSPPPHHTPANRAYLPARGRRPHTSHYRLPSASLSFAFARQPFAASLREAKARHARSQPRTASRHTDCLAPDTGQHPQDLKLYGSVACAGPDAEPHATATIGALPSPCRPDSGRLPPAHATPRNIHCASESPTSC